jgi:ABC-type multidrug transport system fused ATPase/permease subunit
VTQRIGLSALYASFEGILIAGELHRLYQDFLSASNSMDIVGLSASRLFTFVPDLARLVHGYRQICKWEDRKPEVASLESAKPTEKLDNIQGSITFNSCTLQYATRPRPAIDNMSLVIPAGQSVAFCGKFPVNLVFFTELTFRA